LQLDRESIATPLFGYALALRTLLEQCEPALRVIGVGRRHALSLAHSARLAAHLVSQLTSRLASIHEGKMLLTDFCNRLNDTSTR
jgi:hypothetical protein